MELWVCPPCGDVRAEEPDVHRECPRCGDDGPVVVLYHDPVDDHIKVATVAYTGIDLATAEAIAKVVEHFWKREPGMFA